jgi:hypothetical protein
MLKMIEAVEFLVVESDEAEETRGIGGADRT